MKKIISLLLSFIFVFALFSPVSASAQTDTVKESFDDGSYILVETDIKNETENFGFLAKLMKFLKRLVEFFTGQKTVTKTKYVNYYSSADELLWSAQLKASFMYSKKEAVCTDSNLQINIYDSDWTVLSSSCEKSENTARADFSVRQQKLAVPLKTIEKTITLVCDRNGNVN